MIRKTRIAAIAATAAALAALVPAGPAAAASSCQARSLGTHHHAGQFVAVAGAYKGPADAVEVHLTCGIVRDGVTIDRVSDSTTGPAAAVADVRTVPGSTPVTSCEEIKVIHLDGGVTYYDTCP